MGILSVCVAVCILCKTHQFNPTSGDGQIKVKPRLKTASILSSHLLGSLETIFLFPVENPEVGNVYPCMYTSKVSLLHIEDPRYRDADRLRRSDQREREREREIDTGRLGRSAAEKRHQVRKT